MNSVKELHVAIYLFNKMPYLLSKKKTHYTTFQIPQFSPYPKSQANVDSRFNKSSVT